MANYYQEKKRITITIRDRFIEDMKKLNEGQIQEINSEDYVFDLSMRFEYSDKGIREILNRFCERAGLQKKDNKKGTIYFLED